MKSTYRVINSWELYHLLGTMSKAQGRKYGLIIRIGRDTPAFIYMFYTFLFWLTI